MYIIYNILKIVGRKRNKYSQQDLIIRSICGIITKKSLFFGDHMCNKSQAIRILAQAYILCGQVFGDKLREAYLYGSFARGDYDDKSDVDILITVDMSAEELAMIRQKVSAVDSSLSLEHDVTVSITAKPIEQFTRYANILPYYRNVLSEGIKYAEEFLDTVKTA